MHTAQSSRYPFDQGFHVPSSVRCVAAVGEAHGPSGVGYPAVEPSIKVPRRPAGDKTQNRRADDKPAGAFDRAEVIGADVPGLVNGSNRQGIVQLDRHRTEVAHIDV